MRSCACSTYCISIYTKFKRPPSHFPSKQTKFNLVVKLGTLSGAAVGIVTTTGTCKDSGFSPAIRGNFMGSTIFVYHAEAVADFRRDVLTAFFAKQNPAVPAAGFFSNVTALLGTQLGATLAQLGPANAINRFTIAVATTGSPPKPAASAAALPTLTAPVALLSLAAAVSWLAL